MAPDSINNTTSTGPTSASAWAAALVAELHQRPGELAPAVLQTLEHQRDALDTATQPALPTLPPDPRTPTIVRTAAALRQLAEALVGQPVVVVDLETTGLDHRQGEIVGIGFAITAATFYVPVGHRSAGDNVLLPDQLALADVAEAINFAVLPLVAHNAKFEFKWLRHHLHVVPHFVWDTMIAAKLLRSDQPAGLKELASRELDVPDWGLSARELRSMAVVPIEKAARYCAADCWYTLQLYGRQKACQS